MGLHITNLHSQLGTVVLGHGYFDVPLLKSFLKLPTVLQSVGHVYDGDTPFNHLLSTSCKKAAGLPCMCSGAPSIAFNFSKFSPIAADKDSSILKHIQVC